MKIISIDVGIKNLAYCLLDINTNSTAINTLAILGWDSVNLCEKDSSVGLLCSVCKKKATYYYYLDQESADLNHKSYSCICHSKKIENKHEIVKETKISANKIDLVSIGIALKKELDLRFVNVAEIDHVVIENQISPIATRMKTIQGMLMQYFIMRGVHSISFASAINKLKAFTDKKKKISYKDRKKIGIEITSEIIHDIKDIKWFDYFNTHKKKDDLADSFLQGVWYLQMTKMLEAISVDEAATTIKMQEKIA
jgi:hypothetical protein